MSHVSGSMKLGERASSAVEAGPLYKMMKPHLDFVLFECALPTLCASPADVRRFDEDPQEFVRVAAPTGTAASSSSASQSRR